MIIFKPRTNGPLFWESPIINHPEQTGTNQVTYNLEHNLGVAPYFIIMYCDFNDDGNFIHTPDYFANFSTTVFFNYSHIANSDENTASMEVYRIAGGTQKIKFKAFKF